MDRLADGRQGIRYNLEPPGPQAAEMGQAGRVPIQGKRSRNIHAWSMHAGRKREAIARAMMGEKKKAILYAKVPRTALLFVHQQR